MPKRLPRPTEAYILALKAEQEGRPEVIAQRDLLRRIRELRALERAVNVPQRLVDLVGGQGLEFRNPAIADELNALPAMFTANEPNLVINLGRDTKQAVENTTLRENFTKTALLDQIGCREPGPSTFERLVDATFEGGGWTKLLRNRDVWEDRYALKATDYAALEDYDEAVEDAKKKAGVPSSGCRSTRWGSSRSTRGRGWSRCSRCSGARSSRPSPSTTWAWTRPGTPARARSRSSAGSGTPGRRPWSSSST